jgi:hypothetical protein
LGWFGNLVVTDSALKSVIYIADAEMKFFSLAGAAWEPADHFITNGLGSGAWPTTWGGPDHLATLAVFDDNETMVPGTPYEFMGALKPGYRYELTLAFGFYEEAGNEYQNVGPMNISFEAVATQIKADALEAFTGDVPGLSGWFTWMNQQIAKQTMP